MSHIQQVIAQQGALALEAQQELAMEGLVGDVVEKIKAAYGKFKQTFGHKPSELFDAVEENRKTAEKNKRLLLKIKQLVSQAKNDPTKGFDLGAHLRKMGISATDAKGVVAELNKRTKFLQSQWAQIEKLHSDMQHGVSDGLKDQFKARLQKIRDTLHDPKVEETGETIKFTRAELIQLLDAMIAQLAVFENVSVRFLKLKSTAKAMGLEAGYEDRYKENPEEEHADKSTAEHVFDGVLEVVEMFFKLFLIALVFHLMLVLMITNPAVGLMSLGVLVILGNALTGL